MCSSISFAIAACFSWVNPHEVNSSMSVSFDVGGQITSVSVMIEDVFFALQKVDVSG